MRKLMIAVAALAAAPAAAQPAAAPPDPTPEEIRRAMPKPHEVEAMGEGVIRMMDALMGVPIGPLREAVEGRPLSRRERDETIGDRALRDDPHFRERMRDRMAVAGIAMGALAEQMAVMTPVFRRTLEDVERRMDDAMRGAPQRPQPEHRGEDRPGDF